MNPFDRTDCSLGVKTAVGILGGAWLTAGLLDWCLHRRTRIAETAGPRESITHLMMMSETGAAVAVAAFFELDASVQLLGIVAFGAHQATAMWDVLYATPRRAVSPFEAHVHSFLEASHWRESRSALC